MHHVDKAMNMPMGHSRNAVTVAMFIVTTVSACLPNTKTILCEGSSLRCPPGFSCSADQNTCIPNACGDRIISTGELCDDGNGIDGDGCDSNCTFTGCGNGIQTDGESCDDGNLDDNDDCVDDCLPAVCGDNHVRNKTQNNPENCDDGNTITEECPYDTQCIVCDETCHKVVGVVPRCGDGKMQSPEACDDGNPTCGTCNQECNTSTSAKATGQIIVVKASDIDMNKITFWLDDGYNPEIAFELDSARISVPGVASPIFYGNMATAMEVRNAVLNQINAVHDMALLLISASTINNTIIKLTHKRATSNGNRMIMFQVTASFPDPPELPDGFTILGMEGGAGGDCASGSPCMSNADCLSDKCNGSNPGICE